MQAEKKKKPDICIAKEVCYIKLTVRAGED